MNAAKNLDSILKSFTDGNVPGCAAVVMKGSEILYEGYSGYADVENKIPVTERSLFRHASSTKIFTYAIGMMLFEEGKFRFTDPIYEFLPEWKDTKKVVYRDGKEPVIVPVEKPITVKDAFAMTCGYPYCMSPNIPKGKNLTLNAMTEAVKPYYEEAPIITLRNEVRACSQAPAMFEPGTHWQYGLGSEIVGAIVEEITGKSVRANMRERLIEPLGLKDTATFLDEEQMSRLVKCYRIAPDKTRTPFPSSMDDNLKVGGAPEYSRANLNSSCRDFTVFMSMLANGGVYRNERLLSRASIDLMRTNVLCEEALRDFHTANGVDCLGYGYGLGVRTLMDRAQGSSNGTPGAFGWSGGYGSWAEASPEERIGIVYMHNMQGDRNELYHVKVRSAAYSLLE